MKLKKIKKKNDLLLMVSSHFRLQQLLDNCQHQTGLYYTNTRRVVYSVFGAHRGHLCKMLKHRSDPRVH